MRRFSDAHVPRNYCRGLFDLQVSHGRKTLHQSSCAFITLLTDHDYLASRSVTLYRFETLRKGFRPMRGGDYNRDISSRGHFVFPEGCNAEWSNYLTLGHRNHDQRIARWFELDSGRNFGVPL